MPRIRIEWMPVQLYGLGRLGFDHLHLVLEQGEDSSPQDDWFVLEGVRDATSQGIFLGIEGADGRTTLAMANVAARADLTEKIGTPEHRGSRPLAYAGDELHAWETMSSYARAIEAEDFPYIAYGLPGSPTPTINSSSAIASLIHYSGLDPTATLPYGMRLSPGMSTLLGTGGDDLMQAGHGFSTLVGGRGADEFVSSADARATEKFYGGEGNDLFHWSPGFNIVHGGQPQLAYAADGTDVIDYSGAGEVAITFNRHWVPHKFPNFIAVHDKGVDHLFSVERIQWNAKTDRIELGKGINLLEDDRVSQPHASLAAPATRSASLVADDVEVLGDAASATDRDDRLVGTDASEVIDAKAGDDTLYGGGGDDVLIGGPGSDGYVYLPGDGNDVIVDLAGETDLDELLLTGGVTPDDVAAYRLEGGDLLLAVPDGTVLVVGFFAASGAGIERIVFDDAPAWSREDITLRAIALDPHASGPDVSLPAAIAAEAHGDAHLPGWHLEPHLLALF